MKNTIVLAALLLSSTCALAGTGYAGINAGSASHRVSIQGASASDDDTGVKVYGGYHFTPRTALEVGYVHFGETSSTEGWYTVGAKPKSVYAALTASMQASEQFELFAKLGVARNETTVFASNMTQRSEIERSRTSPLLGVGVAYRMSERFSIVGEYEYFGKVAEDGPSGIQLKASLVSIGIRMGF